MIWYALSYQKASSKYVNLKLEVPDVDSETTYVYLPAWRPGKYQMAGFAANVQCFEPFNEAGHSLAFRKINTHCWAIATEHAQRLIIHYNYYAAHLDAGNTYLDENQLYLNPVNFALYVQERMDEPCRVQLILPDDYMVATPLKRAGKNTFEANHFHHLADSPLIASDSLKRSTLDISPYRFHLWFSGIANPDYDQIKQDFKAFIEKAIAPFGEFPVYHYHFFYQLPPYSLTHGVEHQESTVIALGPGYKLMQPDFYKKFLGLSSHELYHTWNVKQIRPAEMVPYRYQEPNYTNLGYIAEGVTTYYGDLILLRSGIFSFEDYRKKFNQMLVRHLHNYGRFYRSVAASSFDTWLDGYQASAPARKTSIYIKGMLVAFLLDIELMQNTGNGASLDTVMYRLYQDFAKAGKGYTEADLKATIESVAETTFDGFFEHYIWGTETLEKPLEKALDYLGLVLKQEGSARNWEKQFGFKVVDEAEKPMVAQVALHSPAERAGLTLKDELVAINGIKIYNNLADLFAYYHTDTIELTLFRNNVLKHLHLTADGAHFFKDTYIESLAAPSAAQCQNFEAWSHHQIAEPETLGKANDQAAPENDV